MATSMVSTGTTSIKELVERLRPTLMMEPHKEDVNACPECGGDGYVYRRDSAGRLLASHCPVCRGLEKARVKTALKLSGIPNAGDGCGIELARGVADYAREFKRLGFSDWLVLTGKPGTGKTTQAAELAKRIITKGGNVRFYNAFNLTRRLIANRKRAEDYYAAFDEFREADLVVLDDFLKSAPARNSFDFNDFYTVTCELLWTRYDDRKPLVITTQKTFNDVALFDSALASRIAEMGKGRFITLGRNATNYRLR